MSLLAYGHRQRAPYLSQDAIPDLMAGVLLAQQFGKDWYVNSAASSGGDGRTPDSAVTTLQSAVDKAAANDRIWVAPGHAETVTATSIALNKAGVTIVCLGNGTRKPTFTFSTAAATITVSASDVTWLGGYFLGNFLDVASAFTIGAADYFRLEGGEFEDSTATLNFLSIVTTGATNNDADGLTIIGNTFYGLNTSPLAFISILANIAHLHVESNFVDSASTADVGSFITFAAKVSKGTRILNNIHVVVGSTGAAVGIFLTGSGTTHTGLVARNLVTSLDTTAELIATAGTGLAFFENYYTGTADASGKLWPTVDGA